MYQYSRIFVLFFKALAEEAAGKKKVLVPYRDSILTKLLKNALGGNRLLANNFNLNWYCIVFDCFIAKLL